MGFEQIAGRNTISAARTSWPGMAVCAASVSALGQDHAGRGPTRLSTRWCCRLTETLRRRDDEAVGGVRGGRRHDHFLRRSPQHWSTGDLRTVGSDWRRNSRLEATRTAACGRSLVAELGREMACAIQRAAGDKGILFHQRRTVGRRPVAAAGQHQHHGRLAGCCRDDRPRVFRVGSLHRSR